MFINDLVDGTDCTVGNSIGDINLSEAGYYRELEKRGLGFKRTFISWGKMVRNGMVFNN